MTDTNQNTNQHIIPYVPIAERVQATNPHSELLCKQLFILVDRLVQAQFSFNHANDSAQLCIAPDQINDLLNEYNEAKAVQISNTGKINDQTIPKLIDIELVKGALADLIYPRYLGTFEIRSEIWNDQTVSVWQFQLNQIVRGNQMKNTFSQVDTLTLLDQALGKLRVWRASLELTSGNPSVTYSSNDLVYTLLDLEQQLEQIQQQIE